MANEKELFYETPKDSSEKEIQRCIEFLSKMKTMVDKTTFTQYMEVMISYHSRTITFTEVKSLLDATLSDVLGQDLQQLLSDLSSSTEEKNDKLKQSINPKPKYGNKIRIRFRKRKHTLEIGGEEYNNVTQVTQSYYIRPKAIREETCHEDINGKYISYGRPYKTKGPKEDMFEDNLFDDDRYLYCLCSIVMFGLCNNEQCEKPPLGSEEFQDWIKKYYIKNLHRKYPKEFFQKNPKLALQRILPGLKKLKTKLKEEKLRKVNRICAMRGSDVHHQQILSLSCDSIISCRCRLN